MWVDPPITLSSLPREPGVYRMLDSGRKVLYVGKARNLRKRVSSYFRQRPASSRTVAMVKQIRDIAFSITPSEAEALVLEHNLIKQLKPRYNVLMKDSKTYPYILLSDEAYPKLTMYRGNRSQTGEYFGPFPNAGAVHQTLHIMQSIFQLRDCENAVFSNRSRPCMQHQIGRCSAPCCDIVSQAEYRLQVDDVRQFLKGRDNDLVKTWQEQMQQASDRLCFEQATILRDRIRALRTVLAGSENSTLPDNADGIALIRHTGAVLACIGVRRAGRNLGTHNIRVDQADDADDLEILQSLFIERYQHESPPAEVVLNTDDANIKELDRLFAIIKPGKKTALLSPKRGPRLQWLQEITYSGEQIIASRKQENQQPAFAALADLFALDAVPELIAAVDNAHLGGTQMVAAITYAGWQGAEKASYHRYKLDGIAGQLIEGDDYGAMRAVLERFFRAIREDAVPCPDLMLIDGGRGQLAIALQCAHDAGLHELKLAGVAKGDARRVGEETLWPGWLESGAAGIGRPLKPGRHSPALLLIARVRDEAHRFAGAYMRKRKKQSMFTSALDGIDGIGAARRTTLLKYFGGIEGVKKAGRKQLMQVPGISEKLAEKIFLALHR
ncbi:MAG: excinuclease ABC subunit UvrC [Zetaproteobacteria bacterium CG12_big_fil_rev_8_21_14_0_65_54_13]|nr:MAG: excinuclease ABC subunit UvrC [Zetaproteobacteria bacterium CG12_big_fil_rev_8_21_14_0_65_54_13]PIX55702.1 MAG: excinuclease ABC subunit UvrC [Zetaproteobacteria bacterium CG_4_10_14_3_um_filter_54_28]PJA28187.1 MAG: excinuclease ABC subunit UvrC [Zetaproteobacteria bacterium CG_4_9_14_3_um_filter_54_145]